MGFLIKYNSCFFSFIFRLMINFGLSHLLFNLQVIKGHILQYFSPCVCISSEDRSGHSLDGATDTSLVCNRQVNPLRPEVKCVLQ